MELDRLSLSQNGEAINWDELAKQILGDEFSNYLHTNADRGEESGAKKTKSDDHGAEGKDGGKLKISYQDLVVFYTALQAQIQASLREIALSAIKKTPLQMEIDTRDLVTVLDAWYGKTFSEDVEQKPV